jgi:hypothetical protein
MPMPTMRPAARSRSRSACNAGWSIACRAASSGDCFFGEHPSVTTASLIAEVADETVQGRYVARCAHAHLLADRVLLDYLFDVNAPAMVRHDRQLLPGGAILLRAVRPRPAFAGPIPSRDLPGAPAP